MQGDGLGVVDSQRCCTRKCYPIPRRRIVVEGKALIDRRESKGPAAMKTEDRAMSKTSLHYTTIEGLCQSLRPQSRLVATKPASSGPWPCWDGMGDSGRIPGGSCGVTVRNRALRYREAEKEKEKQRFSCDRLCRRSARPKAVLDCGRAVGVTYDSLTSWRSFSSTSLKQSKRHQHRHCVASKIIALLC